MVAYGVGKNRETNKEHDTDCADWGSVGQGELLTETARKAGKL